MRPRGLHGPQHTEVLSLSPLPFSIPKPWQDPRAARLAFARTLLPLCLHALSQGGQ